MRVVSQYYCEKCNAEFHWEDDCLEHEKNCGVLKVFCCDKCDKKIEYTTENEHDPAFDFKYNECWIFTPNHYRAGYGSGLEGCEFKLKLCDDCLIEFIKTFKNQDHIWNSGSNVGWDAYEKYIEDLEDELDE
jgi:hypothetical protein